MYLVKDEHLGATFLVFTVVDPRKDGYTGKVIEGVSLDYDMEEVHRWSDGEAAPEACVGRARDDRNHYKVFKYESQRKEAGFQPVKGMAVVFPSWSDYLKVAPKPEQMDDEQWYRYLEELDEAARRRRQGKEPPAVPPGRSPEEVAAWLAKTHLIADSGIREVWYLPDGAPPGEIRLLEVNDRLAGNETKAEPIDFGLDIEGAPYRLYVADVTSDQLNQIKRGTSHLPPGWSLEGNTIWRRGA